MFPRVVGRGSWARGPGAACVLRLIPRRGLSRLHSTLPSEPPAPPEVYRKLTPHEHVLLRPGMYIGSPVVQTQPVWLYDEASACMVWREVEFNAGLYKIFDEILVNALDNRQRDPQGTTRIEVEIDEESGRMSVTNNGQGIPVRRHATEDRWVPQLIMGELYTGSNLDDSTKLTVGGRHGFGAKLTNIFSRSFEVKTADSAAGLSFVQRWHDNMRRTSEPDVLPLPSDSDEGAPWKT